MKFPKRSRSHQLEDMSVAKLQSLIPVSWVYRIPSHDYGVDGEVEIFDDDGFSTGKKFLVQLKATDEPELEKALKLRVGIEKYNYYRQLKQPILIARYISDTDEIYVRWFHSLNPVEDSIAQESFCIKFNGDNILDSSKFKLLEREVDAYFLFANTRLRKPIQVDFLLSSDSCLSNYSLIFSTKLMRSGIPGANIFSFRAINNLSNSPIFIEVSNSEYKISFGVASIRNSFVPPESNAEIDKIVANINIWMAVLLQNLGYSGESEFLFDAFIDEADVFDSELMLFSYVGAKVETNKLGEVLDFLVVNLNEKNLICSKFKNMVQVVMALVTQLSSEKDIENIESTYLTLIQYLKSSDPNLTSILHYNLGNLLNSASKNKKAISHYIKAARINPDYKTRHYWMSELAGLFFCIQKYHWSAKLYSSALNDSPSPRTRGLFADSLMFSGFFKHSLQEFESTISSLGVSHPEWCLKHWCLRNIVHELGVDEQVVGPIAGVEFIKSTSEDGAIEYLKTKNALCPDCWFFIATKLAERNEYDGATVCYLLSAFSDESFMEAWMMALQCSMRAKDSAVSQHVLQLVSDKFGSEVISDFFCSVVGGEEEKLRASALQIIQACDDSSRERKKKALELRLVDGKSLEEISIEN